MAHQSLRFTGDTGTDGGWVILYLSSSSAPSFEALQQIKLFFFFFNLKSKQRLTCSHYVMTSVL